MLTIQNAMGLLRPVSVVATGGAAYYMASDGGDADVLRTRTRGFLDTVDASLPNVLGEQAAGAIRENVARISAIAWPALSGDVADLATVAPQGGGTGGDSGAGGDGGAGVGGIFCHNCSGSRIRYFAEKFGLWRREDAVAQAQAQAERRPDEGEMLAGAPAEGGRYTGPRAWYLGQDSRIKRRIRPDYDR